MSFQEQEIPADTEQIPTPEIVSRIEHLKEIASEIPVYDPELEIGHLIGSIVIGSLHLTSEPFTNKVTVNRITIREIESVKEIITPKSLLKIQSGQTVNYSSC